ncbi:MAG: MarR family transcriptional regulator [Devosia sp.]|uniref:MarR family winged helix-turn-helix transcriptional regulator n=1 Tax=Devosia sp. TaxID=1871048 RepID=UPI0026224523|nr:MarR family transcriptional regulator [Devosia sp.]MDB5529391.1 MarR family transcriptional regulator [Devosia sp.]
MLKNLFIAARELGTEFDAQLKGLGLTSARVRVLLLLARSPGGMTQASIADRLRVEPPTAVRILDGLEALGHIRRLPMPNDRRAKMVELTATGEPLARQAGLASDRIELVLLDGLDPADIAATDRVLASLITRIEALKSADLSTAAAPKQLS